MSAREFLWIVKESALGTPKTSPTAGVDSIYIRLIDGNSFGMIAKPVIEEIPWGGGLAITGESVSDHYECKGQLKTKLYPSQAALLLGWALTRVDAVPNPWATTEPIGDLASCSVYHAVRRSDGTYRRKRFAGCKVSGAKIDVSRQSTTAMLTLDLLGCRSYGNAMDSSSDPDATAFPAPADTDYPSGPYTFKMTAGGITVASARTEYDSLAIAIQNVLDGRWFEQSYLQVNQFCGRASTLETELYLKASPDDRAAYEALTAQAVSAVFTNGVTNQNMTLQFNGQNTITDLPYNLPLNQAFMQKLSLKNRYDPSASNDISVSFA
jgi:Phage tail tube protein